MYVFINIDDTFNNVLELFVIISFELHFKNAIEDNKEVVRVIFIDIDVMEMPEEPLRSEVPSDAHRSNNVGINDFLVLEVVSPTIPPFVVQQLSQEF